MAKTRRPYALECRQALEVLETERRIALPAPRPHGQRPSPRCLDAPVPAPVRVPAQVRDVEGLRLVVVEDEAQRRIWNTLLACEHPQGTTTFVGCQVRYLVGSAHGWLGVVGFSASALRLRARDAWMGWSDEQRRAHLHRVVCLSRFLIRPAVQCRHLASHVLGRVLRRVEADFEARYHYRPWLVETFVEPEHEGVSFKAANFVCVGPTAGRGRCDRAHDGTRTVKSVYLYELAPHWRHQLGLARVEAAPSRSPWRRPRQCTMGTRTSSETPRWETSACRHGLVQERRPARIVSGPCVHRRPGPRGGEGLLPPD